MGKVGLDRALGGQGNSWTEFYLEITYGQSLGWTDSLMDRFPNGVYSGQSWFEQSPGWTGVQLDGVLFGNLVWTESLVDRVYNGLGWDGVLGGQECSWTGKHGENPLELG